MSAEQLSELDYAFHIDGESDDFEEWMHDPETLALLEECDQPTKE